MQYYFATDTETGGLNPDKADLLTFYVGFHDEEFKLVDELYLKLKPDDGRIPIAELGALRVNGINIAEHLADPETVTYKEGREKVIAITKKYLKKNGRYSNIRPMGHNLPFDINWIQKHLVDKDTWDSMIHYGIIDTKTICDFLKDVGWFPKELGTLTSLVDYLGIPKRPAHNAKEDTLMMVDVYKKYLDMMKNRRESSGGQQDLISQLEAE